MMVKFHSLKNGILLVILCFFQKLDPSLKEEKNYVKKNPKKLISIQN